MATSQAQQITTALVLLVQSSQFPSGAYAGLSGLDSLGRSMCTLVDQSVGALIFYTLIAICLFPGKKMGLGDRADIIHTFRGDSGKFTKVSYRARWWDVGDLPSRSGEFVVDSAKGGLLVNGREIRAQDLDTRMASNANHWVYPYLLDWQPGKAGHPRVKTVTLTRKTLVQTTALALARFVIFVATSLIITLSHIVVVSYLFEDNLVKICFILADIGRWLLVVGQLSSIMTYSLDYKGVCTWASPKSYGAKLWCPCDQENCRNLLISYVGRAYHARMCFYLCEFMWPKLARMMPGAFRCFDETSFQDDQSTVLRLKICPQVGGELSPTFVDIGDAILFKVPTAMVQLCFRSRLVPTLAQRMANLAIMGPLCLCSMVIPFLVIWRDGIPSATATILLGIIQVITSLLGFKDIDNWSINCKFVADTPVAHQGNVGSQAPHAYPPRPNDPRSSEWRVCRCSAKQGQQGASSQPSASHARKTVPLIINSKSNRPVTVQPPAAASASLHKKSSVKIPGPSNGKKMPTDPIQQGT
ncbi:hypothetical protein BDP27DRAFT_1337765 [Rhodocollybia butyracea]|uniref:Uncharacterized protein n=1 Tax=Rhodocollybia butyracea TaxID=206335 RepID=A0A9P5PB19_9AGAR|nr:hypothetical protein BDP27DRAFT_1337765 [Rhodocollybia butyracea]